jgi:hypothetical protein
MTLVALPNLMEYPSGLMGTSGLTLNSTTMDAAGEGAAWVFPSPKAGTITKVYVMTGTVTAAEALDVRVETIDASGNPTGTLWAANTNGQIATPAANTGYWVTLTAAATVAAGEFVCIAVRWVSFTAGNLTIRHNYNALGPFVGRGVPYALANTGSWAKSSSPPLFAVEYGDGSRPHVGGFPTNSTTISQTVNTGSTPDEVGAYFSVPFPCKVKGVALKITPVTGHTYAVKLYDTDGTSVLASKTGIDSDISTLTGGSPHMVLFTAEATLTAGGLYRVTFLPETATNQTWFRASVDAAATLESWPGGASFYKTSRSDAGAWTEDQTQIPQMALLLSALDDGAGGGGTNSPGASLVGGRLTR